MKRALVVSGGGSKGAFAVGAIKQLMAIWPGLAFDIFVGTSTGSLIVPLVALNEIELLEILYTTKKTNNIVVKHNLGDRLTEHSIFDANPLWNLITEHLTEERCQQLLTGDKHISFTTTCLQTGALTVFTNKATANTPGNYDRRKLLNSLHLQKAVMASACQPVFMPPIKVNKDVAGAANTGHQYVDGGVREYAGIEMAIDAGATEIFTILLSSGKADSADNEFKDLFSILQQTIDIFTDDVGKNDLIIPAQYNESLLYIDAVKKKMKRAGVATETINDYFFIRGRESPYEDKIPLKLFTIRPDAPLGGGPGGLVFDPDEMKQMLAKGKAMTNSFAASLPVSDVTWV
jgi:predicted acylesterase/phospholipase RssA